MTKLNIKVRVRELGNSMVITLPKPALKLVGWKAGTTVKITNGRDPHAPVHLQVVGLKKGEAPKNSFARGGNAKWKALKDKR